MHMVNVASNCAFMVVAASLAACAHSAPQPSASFDEQIRQATQPVPEDLRAEVAQAEQIGETLYAYDMAAWAATDALFEGRRREELSLGGYFVLPEGDTTGLTGGWQTVFYSADEAPKVLFRVRLIKGQKPIVEALQPPEELLPGMDVLIRARATAIESLQAIKQPINPVILPGTTVGESGHLVYLIAGTTEPNRVVFGRHHRVLISEDGRQVVRAEPLSNTALVVPLEPPDRQGFEMKSLLVTHLVSSTPIETHVLASLQHHVRVLVATDRGDWMVDGNHITFLGPRAH